MHILFGCAMIVLTTFVHASAMVFALRVMRFLHAHSLLQRPSIFKTFPIAGLVVVMFVATFVETLMWAGLYLQLGALDDLATASYFSMVTYTSLGYGDIVLHDNWRLLASFQAANGVIMFGWTTALIFAAVSKVYLDRLTQDSD